MINFLTEFILTTQPTFFVGGNQTTWRKPLTFGSVLTLFAKWTRRESDQGKRLLLKIFLCHIQYSEGPVLVLRDGGIGQNFERYSGFYENIRREAGI